jgi:hypothetical protein
MWHIESTYTLGFVCLFLTLHLQFSSAGDKAKLAVYEAVEAHRIVRYGGSQHFLDNRLTDGDRVVSRPPFGPRNILRTYFCKTLCRSQRYNAAGKFMSIGKSTALIENRKRDLLACRLVAQGTTLQLVALLWQVELILQSQ